MVPLKIEKLVIVFSSKCINRLLAGLNLIISADNGYTEIWYIEPEGKIMRKIWLCR
jgi:hypothetical protein